MNPCNCSTCPHCDRKTGTWDYCNERCFAIEPLYTKEAIEQIGCLSHPDAMEHVIKRLEKSIKIAAETDFIEDNVKNGMYYAITLIRNGVEHD